MRALAPHIYLAVLGDDVVLLDLARDAYHCIPDGADHLRPSANRGEIAPTEEAVAALLAAGFLAERPGEIARRRPPSPPCASLPGGPGPNPRWREILCLSAATLDLLWIYRGRDLGQITAAVARAPPAELAPSVIRLAQLFNRLAPWLPIPRKCLVRSFVLLRFLQRSGTNAQWVFGVRTWPFSAHCWIQTGDMVLDDHWERLVQYEPIFATP